MLNINAGDIIGIILIILGIIVWNTAFYFIYKAIKSANKENKANNKAPIVSDEVLVVSKRVHVMKVSRYYITFQFNDGTRKEFFVPTSDYGVIVEGDKGILQYQGSRFLNFSRK